MAGLREEPLLFSDLALSRRLERAEAESNARFVEARARLCPSSGACWIEVAGAYAMYDRPTSPVTQTFGLGMFEKLTAASLDTIERFFLDRGAPVFHEVSPFAGVETLALLCQRNYRPVETSSALFQPVECPLPQKDEKISVRLAGPSEAQLWSDVAAKGWTHDDPELREFFLDFGAIMTARAGNVCFLAELDGEPGATGALSIHDGVAVFAGAATLPEFRRRGLQGALLNERMRYAHDHGCDLAMMVAMPGSDSQRNAERTGFRIAYTRTKWKLIT